MSESYPSQPTQSAQVEKQNTNTEPLRIAVADDEQDIRDFYARLLPRLGCEVVVVASTGDELLEQCRRLRPGLVITDVMMPGSDGIEVAARLYRELLVPVILVSAHQGPELMRRAEESHVMGHLSKPIKTADLKLAITLAMKRFEEQRQVERDGAPP